MARTTRSAVDTRNALESEYSDAYKAAVGMRPRHSLANLSDAELDAEISHYYGEAEADARIPSGGEGWAFEGEREFFDEQNDFGGSFFGMCDDEMPGCGEDY
jgi:hypothetical protein